MKDLSTVENGLPGEEGMLRKQLDDQMMGGVCVCVISVLGGRPNQIVITAFILFYKTRNLSCLVLSQSVSGLAMSDKNPKIIGIQQKLFPSPIHMGCPGLGCQLCKHESFRIPLFCYNITCSFHFMVQDDCPSFCQHIYRLSGEEEEQGRKQKGVPLSTVL